MNRLEILYSRYERLIDKGYIHTDKSDRYIKTIYEIKDEITRIEAENRWKNKFFSDFLNATAGLTGFQILMSLKNN